MTKILVVMAALLGVTACSNKTEDLKSPCVGADESPCDRRLPANQG